MTDIVLSHTHAITYGGGSTIDVNPVYDRLLFGDIIIYIVTMNNKKGDI